MTTCGGAGGACARLEQPVRGSVRAVSVVSPTSVTVYEVLTVATMFDNVRVLSY